MLRNVRTLLAARISATFSLVSKHRKKSGLQELLSGMSVTAVFGVLWFATSSNFWLIIGLFAGVMPMLQGLSRMITDGVDRKRVGREAPRIADALKEKEILRAARRESGRLTPTVAALKSSVSIEDAEKILKKLVDHGYADMEVTDDGRILYVFPEFLPEGEDPPRLDESS
jgi:hypothetical protein